MAFAKFQENRFRIDGEIAENHAILVNLTASIVDANNYSTITMSVIIKKNIPHIINTVVMFLNSIFFSCLKQVVTGFRIYLVTLHYEAILKNIS